MENVTITTEHQELRLLLEHSSALATALPTLKAETSEGWGALVGDWFQQRLADVLQWFQALIEPLSVTPAAVGWTVGFWLLLWICVALLVGWLTSTLAKALLGRHRPQEGWSGEGTDLASAGAQLEQQWHVAVQDAHWGLAARLRWRLFLARRRDQPAVTPDEFFAAATYRRRWEQLQGAPVSEQYRVMFAANQGSAQWCSRYDSGLSSLEGEARHA